MCYMPFLLFSFLIVNTVFSQVQIVDPPDADFEVRIKQAISEIQIIDTHEHLAREDERLKSSANVDFTYLFRHYAKEDLISASNNDYKGIVELVYNTSLPLTDRWQLFHPLYEAMRSTGYGRVPLIAARDLYGVSDINETTIEELSSKMRDASKAGLYRSILKEKAKIELSIQDMGHRKFDQNYFRHVERFDNFISISSGSEIIDLGAQYDIQVKTIDDFKNALRKAFTSAVEIGAVGVKSGLAYNRILKYDNVSEKKAIEIFNSLLNKSSVSAENIKALQDYIMHRVLDLVDEFDLPIQIHTGLHAGNGNTITNSKPTHLVNLFFEYPNVNFILFHASYPYGAELGTLAKNFPNVFIDMCWSYVISPSYSKRYLHEWIETVPANKIMGFGGDYDFVEAVYAHSVMARQIIADVLIEKVRDRYLSDDEAIVIARMFLRDNAMSVFKLDDQGHPLENMEVLNRPGPIHDWWEIHKTDSGFIRDWKVIGIFEYGVGLEEVYPPEEVIDFDQTYIGKVGQVNWESETSSSDGYLNLINVFSKRNSDVSPKAEGIAYAYSEIESPDEREIQITLGSNDGAKLWVNHEVVYNKHVPRNAVADQEMLKIKLKKGKNRILAKIENIGASWGLYLRLVDPQNELEVTQFKE